jgi:transcriptional regulator with XRE-family HTH domain
MPTLGKFIRRRRMELGLTQEQLAERVGNGVRQAEISRLEHDRVVLPRRPRLEQLAEALDTPIGVLLARSGWVGAEEIEPHPNNGAAPEASAAGGVDYRLEELKVVIAQEAPHLEQALSHAEELIQQSEILIQEAQGSLEELRREVVESLPGTVAVAEADPAP